MGDTYATIPRLYLQLAGSSDDNREGWHVTSLGWVILNRLDDVMAIENLAKDGVLSVEMGSGFKGDEELRAVGVGARVGHAQQVLLGVLGLKVFVIELAAVDRLSTGAVSDGKVTTLGHEAWDDTMEGGALVGKLLAGPAYALLASAESAEVFGGLWDDVAVQLKDDAAGRNAADGDIEENFGTGGHGEGFQGWMRGKET